MPEPRVWLGHRDLCPSVCGLPCDCPCSHPDCPGVDRCQNPECPVVALFRTDPEGVRP